MPEKTYQRLLELTESLRYIAIDLETAIKLAYEMDAAAIGDPDLPGTVADAFAKVEERLVKLHEQLDLARQRYERVRRLFQFEVSE
jgi:hypothetical protein